MAASLLLAPAGRAEEGGASSWDGRFGTSCDTDQASHAAVCIVPFVRLIADPERFEGRFVRLTGFLDDRSGRVVLFPSRDSAEENIAIEGVVLTDVAKGAARRGKWMTVSGRFDAGAGDRPQLGILRDVQAIDEAGPE